MKFGNEGDRAVNLLLTAGQEKSGLDFSSKPDFKFSSLRQKLEGKASPIIQLGLLGLTATLFAGLLVIATGARFAQRAFTIQFFLETS